MIALLRQIILCVTAASLFGAVALSLVPDGALKEITRMGVGIVLILSLIQPFRQIFPASLADLFQKSHVPAVQQDMDDVYQKAILQQVETETAQYIVQQAENKGISCRAEANAQAAEDGTVSIQTIRLVFKEPLAGSRLSGFCQQISADLGVPLDEIFTEQEDLS